MATPLAPGEGVDEVHDKRLYVRKGHAATANSIESDDSVGARPTHTRLAGRVNHPGDDDDVRIQRPGREDDVDIGRIGIAGGQKAVRFADASIDEHVSAVASPST